MDVDPLASMRCWAIEVELGGRVYDIPALPAVDWWPVLASVQPGKVLDLIPSRLGGSDDLDAQLLDGTIAADELGQALRDAVEEVTGRSFHAATILVMVAAGNWLSIGGQLAQTGFRWDQQPIGAALDAIYTIIVSSLEKEPREKFLKLLDDEQLTTGKKRPPDRAKVMAEFEAMAGPRPAPAPVRKQSTGEPSEDAPPRIGKQRQPPRQGGRSSEPRKPPARPAGSDPPASS